jgi:hypothetical protein
MEGTTASPSLDPRHPEDGPPKRTRKVRKDGAAARDEAFHHLRRWRAHLIVRFQHAVLDWLLERGTLFVADLSDRFETPPGIRRVWIGAAVNQLAEDRLIVPTGERRSTTQGGRHGGIFEVWRLGPGVDAARVAEWKSGHPVPPPPEPSEDET